MTFGNHVAVIGGGIAGLSAAWTLCKLNPEVQVTVLESQTQFGGKIRTTPFAGRNMDTAADAFLARVPWATQLCSELGISGELVAPARSNAWLWSSKELVPYPTDTVLGIPSNLGSLSDLLPLHARARAAFDLVLPRAIGRRMSDSSIGALIRTRLGNYVADRLVDPLVGGINAGSIDALGLVAAAPISEVATSRSLVRGASQRLRSQPSGASESDSVFLAPRAGMQSLVDVLASQLSSQHVELRADCTVNKLHRAPDRWTLLTDAGDVLADAVVLATPAPTSAALLRNVNTTASTILSSVRHASVAMIRLAYAIDAVPLSLDGSGFVVPAVDGHLVTACSWTSSKWQQQANTDTVVMRASVGRFADIRWSTMSDEQIIDTVHNELQGFMQITASPLHADVTRWIDAFPQYEPGHTARIGHLHRSLESTPGLAVAGAAYGGIGIPACIKSGTNAASAVNAWIGQR